MKQGGGTSMRRSRLNAKLNLPRFQLQGRARSDTIVETLRAIGERARVRGLDAPVGWLQTCGALRLCRPCAQRDPRTWGSGRERSASTHATQVQNGKLCMRAKRNGALRRVRTEY
eukprot:6175595-Pleurochrysis_carterae.AAC.4